MRSVLPTTDTAAVRGSSRTKANILTLRSESSTKDDTVMEPSALAVGFKAVLVASGSGLKTGKRPPEQFQPIVMAVD